MMLNKRDSNRIFKLIERMEFDPAEFEFENTDEKVTLTHSSGSVFEFFLRDKTQVKSADPWLVNFLGNYRYAFRVVEGLSENGSTDSVDAMRLYIQRWLDEIRETVGVPDFWEELKYSRQLLAEIQQDSANTPFTENERWQISGQLQAIKTQLREQFELTSEQIKEVDKKLDEVAEASERMGRKDWLIYFLGTITALIITSTVAPGVGEHIFTMVIQGVAHLFTGGTEPPPIPPTIIT